MAWRWQSTPLWGDFDWFIVAGNNWSFTAVLLKLLAFLKRQNLERDFEKKTENTEPLAAAVDDGSTWNDLMQSNTESCATDFFYQARCTLAQRSVYDSIGHQFAAHPRSVIRDTKKTVQLALLKKLETALYRLLKFSNAIFFHFNYWQTIINAGAVSLCTVTRKNPIRPGFTLPQEARKLSAVSERAKIDDPGARLARRDFSKTKPELKLN